MPKPAEIVAALGDISDIESYATLQADMVDLFTTLADGMKKWNAGTSGSDHAQDGGHGRDGSLRRARRVRATATMRP